jgi:hypothetical protein
MKKNSNNSDDELRREYDLNKLRVVAVGPGWKKGIWSQGRSVTHLSYKDAPACHSNGANLLLTSDESKATCKKCLQVATQKS